VRSVPRAAARIAESAAMGFTHAIVPASAAGDAAGNREKKLETIAVRTVEEAIAAAL
jgi:predicted ATP-dependent serine protease